MTNPLRFRTTPLLASALLAAALLVHQPAQGARLLSAGSKTATSGGVSDSHFYDGGNQSYASMSSASFGSLSAASSAHNEPSAFNIFGGANAGFRDDFLIESATPSLLGTTGTATVRFTISGALTVSTVGEANAGWQTSSTYASASYIFGSGNPTSFNKTQTARAAGVTGQEFLGIEQVHVLTFTFGTLLEDVRLHISASSASTGSNGGTYGSTTSANVSAAWGGIVEIRDSGGNLVTDYSVSSTSGTNYVQAVPEPGSTALLVAGGLGFHLLRMRRRRPVTA